MELTCRCYLEYVEWIVGDTRLVLGGLWVLPGWHWVGLGCCLVDVGWIMDGVGLVFGSCWVGYQWESWCRVLLGYWVVELVFLVVFW